jgi:hypothetical protein
VICRLVHWLVGDLIETIIEIRADPDAYVEFVVNDPILGVPYTVE